MSRIFCVTLALLVATNAALAAVTVTPSTDGESVTILAQGGDNWLDVGGGALYDNYSDRNDFDHSKNYVWLEQGFGGAGYGRDHLVARNIVMTGDATLRLSAGAKLGTVTLQNSKLADGGRVFRLNANGQNYFDTNGNQIQYQYDWRTGYNFTDQGGTTYTHIAAGAAHVDNVILGSGSEFKTGLQKGVGTDGRYAQNVNVGAYTGSIGNLSFWKGDLGAGTVTVTSSARPGYAGRFGGFNRVDVDAVDLTGGNIKVDLTLLGYLVKVEDRVNYAIAALLADDRFDLASLFAEDAEVTNANLLNSLSFVSGSDVFNLVSGGKLATNWHWEGTVAVYSETSTGGGNAAPEPATLALFGMGLTGLALARRRRK